MKKKLLIVPLLYLSLISYATTYYVSTTGNNNNSGTLSSPFATLNKAWSKVSAGDIIYVRGGTYTYAMMGETVLSGKNGTADKLITVSNYPGESPVINFSANTFTSQIFAIWVHDVKYLYLKGIRITSVNQPSNGKSVQYGLILYDNVSNCTFEQVETDHIGGWGVHISDYCSNILFLNCDSHHNSDRYSPDSWGGSDGFQSNSWCESSQNQGSTGIIFRGCRSYWNSDDGWDLRRCEGVWTFENCWSFWNGYRPGERLGDEDIMTEGGNGEGLKVSGNYGPGTNNIRRIVQNCLIFENRATGLGGWADVEGGPVGMHIYNNTVYSNGVGFGFSDLTGSSTTALRNNISYANTKGNYFCSPAWYIHDHNNWDISIKVSDADFLSVNSVGMDGPRQANGSLPALNFLKLAEGSALINAGVDVDLPFDSKAPDPGAYEFISGSPAPSPAYISSVIEAAAPSLLEMTFDLKLDNSKVPANSSFVVLVNSQTRTINSVSVSGYKVQLNLAKAVVFGDLVTVSYTRPASNPLQTISRGEVANISAASVTNNCVIQSTSKDPPVVIVKAPEQAYAGFVNTIDATSTYDPDNDPLIVNWTIPKDVPVSTTVNNLKTQFLAPVVENPIDFCFQLKVSNGDTLLANDITIKVLPYKPELTFVRISKIKASDFTPPDSPDNIIDRNTLTKWSSNGDNKWLLLTFAGPFKISHIEVAFLHGQQYESYFDVYASTDTITWEPVLINAASCNFSGERQVFNFPAEYNNTGYSYLKYIGHGNAVNRWNNISEFRIFGSPGINPGPGESDTRKVLIYPNPASDYINISIIDPDMKPDDLRIRDLFGKIVFEKVLNPTSQNVQIPITLKSGIYAVDLILGKLTLFSQKLIVMK